MNKTNFKPTIAIIMGSTSDLKFVTPIEEALKKRGYFITVDTIDALSAHRTLEPLEKVVRRHEENGIQLIIAAAGLNAALPGGVASLTLIPVLGVGLNGAFGGLDAVLAIAQMPPGVPDLCVFTEDQMPKDNEQGLKDLIRANMIADTAVLMLKEFKGINIVVHDRDLDKGVENKRITAATDALKEFGQAFKFDKNLDPGRINIQFMELYDDGEYESGCLTITCAISEKTDCDDAYRMLELAKRGPIVGLDRGENAALMALRILATKDKGLLDQLQLHKEAQAQSVLDKNANMKESR
jgi:phosphoribosylaminoimidazole carboxylase PurE protein